MKILMRGDMCDCDVNRDEIDEMFDFNKYIAFRGCCFTWRMIDPMKVFVDVVDEGLVVYVYCDGWRYQGMKGMKDGL